MLLNEKDTDIIWVLLFKTDERLPMNEACKNRPYVITMTNKTDVTSPNYPFNYENNMDCKWHMLAGKRTRIQVSIRGEIENR